MATLRVDHATLRLTRIGWGRRGELAGMNLPSIVFVHTYYPEFLSTLYTCDAELAKKPFADQRKAILDTGFCLADAYSYALRKLGCPAEDLIVNADPLQQAWAIEHGVDIRGHGRERRAILAAQIEHLRPDVVYVFEWSPLGDTFLAEIKSSARLLVGQVASPVPRDRTFAAYDLMISSWPPIVDHFRRGGAAAEPLRLGFDRRVLDRVAPKPAVYDVTFVGGFAPSHPDRIEWLERLSREIDVDVFGYGVDNVPSDSPVRSRHRGEVWGWKMYDVLAQSRVTLNRHAHIDIDGQMSRRFANNMRLYEATGVGTCLITESRNNLAELFTPGREVVTYDNDGDCVEKIRFYLEHEAERAAIATAGQTRTLKEHIYERRMAELLDILRHYL